MMMLDVLNMKEMIMVKEECHCFVCLFEEEKLIQRESHVSEGIVQRQSLCDLLDSAMQRAQHL